MLRCLHLLTIALTLSTFSLGCSDLFPSDDPPERSPLDFWDRPAPAVRTTGRWQRVEAPPLSQTMRDGPPSFLGKVGETLYLTQKRGRDERVIEVDTRTGEWKVAEALEALPVPSGEPQRIERWGDSVYFWVDREMYRRDADGGEWQEAPVNFAKLVEIDGTFFGYSAAIVGDAARTLFRKQPGGEWEELYDDVSSVVRTGDIIHISRAETHLYSDDGGQDWQEYEERSSVFNYAEAVFYDGRYWSDDARAGNVRVSDDGFRWRQEESEGLEGTLNSLVLHGGEMYAIERSEMITYSVGRDRLVKWTGQGWEPQPSPMHTRLNSLHSVGETLYVDTRSAGVWRSDDAASWEPVGPALAVPSEVAVGDFGLCAFEGIFGVLSCRPESQSRWWREGVDSMSTIEKVFDDDGELYFAVEVYVRPDERYPDTELWSMASDGSIEMIAQPDAARLGHLQDVIEHDGKVYLLVKNDGLFRLEEEGASAEQVFRYRGTGSDSYMRDAAVADEQIWMINRSGSYGSVRRIDQDGQAETLMEGLPSQDPELDDTPPRPMNFAQTDDDLYVMVHRDRFNSGGQGGVHTMAQVYVWSEERLEWLETPLPSHQELGGESLSRFEGSADALYAASDTKVYQYNPAQNAWIDISHGLPGESSIFDLAVSHDRVYVIVNGHGMYEYGYGSTDDRR